MNSSQEANFMQDFIDNNPKHQKLQQEVETVQPKRDPGQLSSNEITKRMDSESDQVRAELSSRKKKRKKPKREHDFLIKSEKDQGLPQEVEIASSKRDQCQLSSNAFCETMDIESNQVGIVLSSSKKSKGKMQNREHDVLDTNCKVPALSPELEAVQPKVMCPQSSNDLIKKMETEGYHVDAELCSSNKKKRKKKKKMRGNNVTDKSNKDQDLPEEVAVVQPKRDTFLQSPANECLKLGVMNHGQEAASVSSVLEIAELGSSRDSSLILGKQNGSRKNESTSEVEVVRPSSDLCPLSSNGFIKKMDTEGDKAHAELTSSNKRKRKDKKQKRGNNVLDKSDKDHDPPQENENTLKVDPLEPNRDLCPPSSNHFIKEVDKEINQVDAEFCSSNKKKRKRKKPKRENNILDKNVKNEDFPEKVETVQPKQNLEDESLANDCLKLEDRVRRSSQEASGVYFSLEGSELGLQRDISLMLGKQSGSLKNAKISEVEAVQPKNDLCPPSSNDFTSNKDAETDQIGTDVCSSKKRTRKRNKLKSGNKVLDKCDEDQCVPEKVATVQPERDQFLQYPANTILKLEDTVMNFGLKAGTVETVSKVAELGSRSEDSLVLGKQSFSLNYENTSEVEAVQANGDLYPLSSDNFIKKMDTKGDQANAEQSSSNQRKSKKMKHKRRNNVIDKSDKSQDLLEQVVITQPKGDLGLPSPAHSSFRLEDELGNIGQEAACVQSGSEFPELCSRRENFLILENQSDFLKNENTAEVQERQPLGDLRSLSSNDFIEKMDTESQQVNADLSTSSKKKRRKKRETGNNALNQIDKDQDLPEEVVIAQPKRDLLIQSLHGKCLAQDDEIKNYGQVTVRAQTDLEVAELGSRKDDSLMPGKQSGSGKNKSSSGVEAVQPNRDLPPLSSNDFIEKMNAESNQVNADLGTSSKKKRRRKKREMGSNALNQSDKDQDLPEQVVIAQPKGALLIQSSHGKCLTQDDEIKNYGQVAVSAQTDLEVAEFGSRKEDSLMPGKQSGSAKNESTAGVEAVQPNRILAPLSSNDFIEKMDTESNQVNADLSTSSKKKRRGKKREVGNNALNQSDKDQDLPEQVVIAQPKGDLLFQSLDGKCLIQDDEIKNYGQVAVSGQTDLEVAELGSRKEGSLMPGKQSGSAKNENTSGVEAVQPNRDSASLSSNDFIEKMDIESNQVNADLSTSSKKKRRKKKQETGNNALNQSNKDQGHPEVVIAQPKGDPCLQSLHRKCLKQDDEVKNYDQVTGRAQTDLEVAELGSRKDDSLMPGKQSGSRKNKSSSGVEAVQPNRNLPLLSSNDFIEKMDTESNKVNADLSTSSRKKRRRKKGETGNNALHQSDKVQDLSEEVVITQPKGDLHIQSLHGKCLTQDDGIKNYGQVAVSARTDLEVAELGSSKDDSLKPGKQSGYVKNENTSGVEAEQPNRVLAPLSSNGFIEKIDTESDQLIAGISMSNKKKRKKKKPKLGTMVLDKSDKDLDLPEDVLIAQPKRDMPLQTLGSKYIKQDDEIVKGQEAVNVESTLEVTELVSGRNISFIPGQQSGSLKNKNTLEVKAVLSNGDMRPLSSNDFDKKLDTESVQVKVELSSSNMRKRKRKKQKSGNNVLDKVDKDQDLPKDLKVAISDRDKFQLGLHCESKLDIDKALVHHGISTGRKKLLILDINGLLVDIVPYGNLAYKPDTSISRKAVFKRPFCDDFLHFCFERFNVAVWSSRTKANLNSAINFLMRDSRQNLLFCWDQSHCTRTRFFTLENKSKPLFLKVLKKVWEQTARNLPWKMGDYNEANTLLVDDSPYKALRNPAYTAIFPLPYQHSNVEDASLGPGGDLRVYLEGLFEAQDVQRYVKENPFGQEAITESNEHWHFYSQIL